MNTFQGSDHNIWASAGLKDYGDFADSVSFCDQSEYGDGQLEGHWFFADDEPMADGSRVIYWGTFDNYNAPGASDFTHAQVYGPDEHADYRADVANWESHPEYVDTDKDEHPLEEGEDDLSIPGGSA